MAFWNKSEIEKIKSKYGVGKGTQLLTYFHTHVTKSLSLMKSENDTASDFAIVLVEAIRSRHGQSFLNEYNEFFKANLKNSKLLRELERTGTTYIDNSISAKKPPVKEEPQPQKQVQTNKPEPRELPKQQNDSLGRDASKHIACKYKGREDQCPDDCSRCAIAIKTDGDVALAQNNLDAAIRLYKKAVFISPIFAEAWVNLGNAYGMKSEYNNSLTAFDKAIAIDPKYGKALLGKAITLKNLGLLDQAMALANQILEMYDDAAVKSFKADLIRCGVKDKGIVIDSQKAKSALVNKAAETMRANNLLNSEGKAEIIPEIFQPEEFTKAVLTYCKRKYASLGENKVRGECVITSYYGSICAVVLNHRDPSGMRGCDVFAYLNDHLDVEFTDVNAERLLGTKAGEEKAEAIWGILSPYLTLAQAVFESVDELTDETMLEAMKHAYILGMLVARYYTSEKNKKHSLGTRAEIDQALRRLSQSSKDYTNPPKESAMCYSIREPIQVEISFRCSKCSANAKLKVYEGEEGLIDAYRTLAKEFVALGHKAEVQCLCDSCAEKYFPSKSKWDRHNIVFMFSATGDSRPVYSYPSSWRYSDFAYKTALSFLKGADTINALSEDTETKLDSEVYLKHVRSIIGAER